MDKLSDTSIEIPFSLLAIIFLVAAFPPMSKAPLGLFADIPILFPRRSWL